MLYELDKAAGDTSKSLYDRNRDVYDLLRYGVKVKPDVGENTSTVWLIDWKNPENNDFAIAEEVTVPAADAKAHDKRPDVVLYVNGIALGVLELKRSTVSVAEGIRQNLDNQKKEVHPAVLLHDAVGHGGQRHRGPALRRDRDAGEVLPDLEGGRAPVENPLDRALIQLCDKARFLELIHDFIVFDAGIKKLCRHNQYFGVRAAQDRREAARGRHHLAHAGQRQEPDHGLAGQVDSGARHRSPAC